jgi:hypothetical protein
MPKTTTTIGPADHGKRMSLADFDHVPVQKGVETGVRARQIAENREGIRQ